MVHPSIKEHLCRQGLVTDRDISDFLFPKLADLPSPFLMQDMDKAAEIVISAIHDRADIIIWGDYDVDGITATALLMLFFKKLNIAVSYHIPNRLTEGYGLNREKITEFSEKCGDRKLLISVDCGISNQAEITLAQELGFTVIVTDHHQLPEKTVTADAVLNPKQLSCNFPFKELSGVGIAFYFASAIRSKLRSFKNSITDTSEVNMKYFTSLVMLGTIADVVPLTGVNRILARAGMESLLESPLDGISALLEILELPSTNLSSESISFQVGPLINAAGRLGDPVVALKALTSSGDEAQRFAKNLLRLNRRRKEIGNDNLETALGICRSMTTEGLKALVLNGQFHQGLLGITASRLVETFNIPALVCCLDEKTGKIKGSARAPDNFDLYSVLRSCSRFLEKFGGHKAAAGFSLKPEHFSSFSRAFNSSSGLEFLNNDNISNLLSEKNINLPVSDALDPNLLVNLMQLEPQGEANPKPFFYDPEVR
ncbi:MAG: single-stranded-DNA-specific exonuclease RecJ, partial [Desulfocapsaceae bacterium]|nr:single-stranded-DNA-specific exonuclease RecJ [Desulfocapsaceae bacterium]